MEELRSQEILEELQAQTVLLRQILAKLEDIEEATSELTVTPIGGA